MRKEVLRTNNLVTGYLEKEGNEKVIGNYNQLSLLEGDFCVLIGKNGVGKSTLLKTLSADIRPLKGEVYISDQDILEMSISEKSLWLSFVYSNNNIVGKLTVIETVLMGRYPYLNWWGKMKEKDHQIAYQALLDVGAEHIKDRIVTTLSDGERQKVMIARAIAQDTAIIFLDEPSAHLDLINRIEVFQLLKKIARLRKKVILLSTHEIEMSLQMADRLWILHDDLISQGTPAEIVSDNIINKVFSSKNIAFNPSTGVFNFCPNQKMFSFSIELDDSTEDYQGETDLPLRVFWEEKKLVSEGALKRENGAFYIKLVWKKEVNQLQWRVIHNDKEITLNVDEINLFDELVKLYSNIQ